MTEDTKNAAEVTPTEAAALLAGLSGRLESATAKELAAKEAIDESGIAEASEELAAIANVAIGHTAAITPESISGPRAKTLIRAAAAGLSPAQLKRIAEAVRVHKKENGMTLPKGKYENLSRGKGWCRQGTGANAVWGDRVDGGYLVREAGRWDVGSSDGFSRKDSVRWDVQEVAIYLIAS